MRDKLIELRVPTLAINYFKVLIEHIEGNKFSRVVLLQKVEMKIISAWRKEKIERKNTT